MSADGSKQIGHPSHIGGRGKNLGEVGDVALPVLAGEHRGDAHLGRVPQR